jgi:catechol 2,3-dioxygenase-like lactoylglutathione lyase family enzyme
MSTLSTPYHVGIIVSDLARAKSQLTEQLGLSWGPVLHLDHSEFRGGDGEDLLLPTTFCYSVEQPCLEIIEEVPGSVWVRNDHSNLHHVGFWSDDFANDAARLDQAGCPMQLAGRAGKSAPVGFTYQRNNDLGVRIELVDVAMRDAMSFLFVPDTA